MGLEFTTPWTYVALKLPLSKVVLHFPWNLLALPPQQTSTIWELSSGSLAPKRSYYQSSLNKFHKFKLFITLLTVILTRKKKEHLQTFPERKHSVSLQDVPEENSTQQLPTAALWEDKGEGHGHQLFRLRNSQGSCNDYIDSFCICRTQA